jgi:hypothetical protein
MIAVHCSTILTSCNVGFQSSDGELPVLQQVDNPSVIVASAIRPRLLRSEKAQLVLNRVAGVVFRRSDAQRIGRTRAVACMRRS